MQIQFDSKQDYQLAAIQSIIDIFKGQPLRDEGSGVLSADGIKTSTLFNEQGIGNHLCIDDVQLLQNIQTIQAKNRLEPSLALAPIIGKDSKETLTPYNFTIEMETGTGKTYTFLRTIYELNKVYGFLKFVIVVPNVAIREGIMKSLEITHEHLQTLYDRPPIDFEPYNSTKLTLLRNFASSNDLQILVINIDAFAKESTVINSKTDKMLGARPIDFLQATNPIVIVDEPQRMDTEIRQQAIHRLNPLCTLRFSATHKDFYNLLYSLNPVQAYEMGLVKQIEVDSVTAEDDTNTAQIEIITLKNVPTMKVQLRFLIDGKDGAESKTVTMNPRNPMDLFLLSNGLPQYKDCTVVSIDFTAQAITLSNGRVVRKGEAQNDLDDEILKYQIERTIKWHLQKELIFRSQGLEVKVLSLFFIDKVKNYRDYDADRNVIEGKFLRWFEELYTQYSQKSEYNTLFSSAATPRAQIKQVHDGYFSQDKDNRAKDSKKDGSTKADNEVYNLIMKDKERLLDEKEPLRFLFSHSALKEGWDNPNVFQICTLREVNSELERRQTVGRGLRLPVNSVGERIFDKRLNLLTVICRETYASFAKALQNEIQADTSVKFEGIKKAEEDKPKPVLTKQLTEDSCPEFFELWNRIKQHTTYSVHFTTDDLIQKAAEHIVRMPRTVRPTIRAETNHVVMDAKKGITGNTVNIGHKQRTTLVEQYTIPDIYHYIQNKIDITRGSIFKIIERVAQEHKRELLAELYVNPQVFLENMVEALHQTMTRLLVDGVKYHTISGQIYTMLLFPQEELAQNLAAFAKVNSEKSLYTYIACDSEIEKEFVRKCDADERVKFYFKLPRKFFIRTPIGNYTPDWAVIFQTDTHELQIYFVVETKGTRDTLYLRESEQSKIHCAGRHFAEIAPDNLQYVVAKELDDLRTAANLAFVS